MTITTIEVWSIAGAVLASIGGGGVLLLALSSWLGKIWANRILEGDKAKYQKEFAELKSELDRRLHAHNVAAARLDTQRVDAIRGLYGALVAWHEAVIQIIAPNKLPSQPPGDAVGQYRHWSQILHSKSDHLEQIAMYTAIYFSEETYQVIAKCGMSASLMSIDFIGAVRNSQTPNTPQHVADIETARQVLSSKYQSDYEPARKAVVIAFRQIVDPNAG
jgi:kynurenine formamidase